MKNIVRLAFMWICANTMAGNLNADITTTKGDLRDWEVVVEIAAKMHTELFEELEQVIRPGYLKQRMDALKEQVKNGELKLVCCYKDQECVGYCTFRIDKDSAYLCSCSHDEEKIENLEFKNVFLKHFANHYPEVIQLFLADMFPDHNGPVMTKYRNRWSIFGFIQTDDPRAKLCIVDASKRDGAQGYVLTLSSEGDTDFNLPD